MNRMMAIDIGNSAVKLGQINWENPATLPSVDPIWELRPCSPGGPISFDADNGEFQRLLRTISADQVTWIVSSVHRDRERQLSSWLREHRPRDLYHRLTYRDIPLAFDVNYPERVGLDRLASAVTADRLRPAGIPAIVVDAGTALKVHAVTARGSFVGGAIFPGYRLAAQSLAAQTDLLPEIGVSSKDQAPAALGRDTEGAIRSGLYWGFAGAAKELVHRVASEIEGEPVVFVSGGDAQGLADTFGKSARFVPEMCLLGVALLSPRAKKSATVIGES